MRLRPSPKAPAELHGIALKTGFRNGRGKRMYSVFLVDDEEWGLSALEASFQWEKFGFRVVQRLTRAQQALQAIRQEKPDVVFADIRMPGMSGLELIDRVRESGTECEFLIVSGYADFQYAQEAIGKGVLEYILKPIDASKTDAILERLRTLLDAKRHSENERLLKEPQRLLQRLRSRGALPPDSRLLAAMMLGITPQEDPAGEAAARMPEALALRTSAHSALFLFRQTDKNRRHFAEFAQEYVSKGISTGLSRQFGLKDDLESAIEEARAAAMTHFLMLLPGVRTFFPSSQKYFQEYSGKIRTAVSTTGAELPALLRAFRADIAGERLGMDAVEYLVEDVRNTMLRRHDLLLPGIRAARDLEHLTAGYENVDAFLAQLAELVAAQLTQKQTQSLLSGNAHFKKLLDYVDTHYDEPLQLRSLAERFFMNMSYCSELFKKMTGKNFSEYLTSIRMEAAMQMLQTGEYSIGTVAAKSGYSDYYYFCKVFKKYYGISPNSV